MDGQNGHSRYHQFHYGIIMPKDLSDDFEEEMAEEQNRPFLLIQVFLPDGLVWYVTTLDENVEVTFTTSERLMVS